MIDHEHHSHEPPKTVYALAALHNRENPLAVERDRFSPPIRQLREFLGRPPGLLDLAPVVIRMTVEYMRALGLHDNTVHEYRTRLEKLRRFAIKMKWVTTAELAAVGEPTPAGTVVGFFHDNQESIVGHLKECHAIFYHFAVELLDEFNKRPTALSDLNESLIFRFQLWCIGRHGRVRAGKFAAALRQILRRVRPANESAVSTATYNRTSAPEGSLSWFVETHYLPERSITPGTVRYYVRIVQWFSKHLGLAFAMLSDLTAPNLNSFLLAMSDDHRSPSTVATMRVALLTLWRAAYDHELIETQPRRIRKIVKRRTAPDAWTAEELARIIAATGRPEFDMTLRNGVHLGRIIEGFIRVAYDTGLRLGDIERIELEHLHPKDGIVVIIMGKTGHAHTCRVRPATLAVIESVRVEGDQRLLPWPYDRTALHKYYRRVLTEAGLPASRRNGFQKLRRTSASHLEAIAPGTATGHLGHRSADMARRHYLDPKISSRPALPPELPELPNAPPADDE